MYSVSSAGTVETPVSQSVSVPAYSTVALPGLVLRQGTQGGFWLGFVASDCSVAMETKTLATNWAHEK